MSTIRRNSLLAIAALVFIAAAFAPVLMYVETNKAYGQIVEARSKISTNASGEQEDIQIKQLFRDTEDERATLDSFAAKKDEAAKIISTIESAGVASAAALEVGSVALQDKNANFSALTVAVHASGSFAAVIRFLKLLESLPYASSVDSVSLSADDGGWQLTSTVSVLVHKNI